MKRLLSLKIVLVFLSSFALSMLAFHGIAYYLRQQQEESQRKQAQIILENIKDRFKLFIRLPVTVGTLGAEHFALNSINTRDYGPFNIKVLQLQKEIIGLNILDKRGVIVRVFPEMLNSLAKGKKTQNFEFLMQSLVRGEKYWLSPPFRLYQGMRGFAMYFPIVRNEKLHGWFATTISTDNFMKHFNLERFLNAYELIIKDEETNKAFYATAIEPEENGEFHVTSGLVDGRKVSFKLWRKNPLHLVFIPWSWTIIASIFLSVLIVTIFKFYEQRRRISLQLDDISTLLKLTSKEALSKLVDLQNEFYKLGSPETINYITHLIEQIDLLQTTANTKREIECKKIDLLPCILKEIDELKELSEKKNLLINVASDKFIQKSVYANPWMFSNIILSNVLSHLIIQAEGNSAINIDCHADHKITSVVFHAQRIHELSVEDRTAGLERRMAVAKKVLHIFDGTLNTENELGGGQIITLNFPTQL